MLQNIEDKLSSVKKDWRSERFFENFANDHVHMLVEIPPKMSVSGFVGYLKGKSSLIIYQRWGNLKFKYRNREFWCRGYYVDTVGKNKAKIAEYIRNQLKEDEAVVQMTIDFDEDPFTGS